MNSPVRHTRTGYVVTQRHGGNFSVDSAAYLQMIARRKSFRTRGSLGPTVASARQWSKRTIEHPNPQCVPSKMARALISEVMSVPLQPLTQTD
uniref:Uncharacterized protein n=1 Tax=Ditylenchus dipsaci TaxID=166011 RepID=A0A915EES6_9BILA